MPELALKLASNALVLLIALIAWGLENRWHDRRTKTRRRWTRVLIGLLIAVTAVDGAVTLHTHGQEQEEQERAARIEEGVQELVKLARERDPTLTEDAALASLRDEIEGLRTIAAKHKFTPLVPELRAEFVARLRGFASEAEATGFTVIITHETWSPPPTRQYAAQLARLLREGGLQVEGPKAITYFLVNSPSPLEWGYNEADMGHPHMESLYQAVLTIIHPNPKWTKASHQKPGSVRIHFGGEAVFQPDGVVAVI